MSRKYILVRSPRPLIERGEIGYGWGKINFSEHSSFEQLFQKGFLDKGTPVGRKKNQIKKYFNLKSNDIVVIPTSGAIALAKVEGSKSYNNNSGIKYSENRIKVHFLEDKHGNSFIPRKALTTKFQSRLKIRMAISDLSDFADEIEKHISSLDNGTIHTWNKELEKNEQQAEYQFKKNLLERLKSGKNISLAAGGYGLEKLVSELLQINGYEASIQAKNQSSGIDDIDIVAKKHNFLTDDTECFYIQVKHHSGTTGFTGLNQLTEYNNSEEYSLTRKILISTGQFSEKLKEHAENENIYLIDGSELVNLIYNIVEELSQSTKKALGITTRPQLI